ncbi:MAG: EamA family transporter [Bacteroidetes bacterium]|nr:EamA family transporter [Bacteroidota bacterium]
MQKSSVRGLISIIFVMAVWGSSFTVTKLAMQTVPPLTFAFLRFMVASLVLLPLLLLHRRRFPEKHAVRIPWAPVIAMGLTGVTLFYVFFNLALMYTSASLGALLQGFIPVCIAVLAAIFLRERLTARQIVGILLSVAGVVIIGFLADDSGPGQSSLQGNIYMIISVLAWSVYTILSKKLAHIDPLISTSWVSFIGTFFLLPVALWENRHRGIPSISTGGWLAILYLGAIASAVCYFLYNKALETLSASQVGNFINLDPVIGLVIALLVLPEHINRLQIAGGVLVLAGIWLSSATGKETAG